MRGKVREGKGGKITKKKGPKLSKARTAKWRARSTKENRGAGA